MSGQVMTAMYSAYVLYVVADGMAHHRSDDRR